MHASDGGTSANPTPVPQALATRFTNCTFEDVPWTDGRVYQNGSLYNLPDSTPGVNVDGNARSSITASRAVNVARCIDARS